MTPYWVLFAMWAVGAVQSGRDRFRRVSPPLYVAAAVLTALMIGLRYAVGGDWLAYIDIYQEIYFQPFDTALLRTDPGYAFLNWLGARGDLGIWFVNLCCGTLFMAGLGRLASRQPNPWLAVLVAVPYLVIVVAMGYTRQAAAIGIICWALADAAPERQLRLFLAVGAAALFHKTAILFLPVILAPLITRSPVLAAVGSALFAVLFNLFLGSSTDSLIANYVNSDYDSQGAGVRVAMNVLAAGCFLVFRERMGLDDFKKKIWTLCAALAVVSVVALVSFSASSGVDRLALFLIPLQVVTFSRLPYALSGTSRPLPSALIGVMLYCAAVQLVWLNYADNARSWVPYQAVPLVES